MVSEKDHLKEKKLHLPTKENDVEKEVKNCKNVKHDLTVYEVPKSRVFPCEQTPFREKLPLSSPSKSLSKEVLNPLASAVVQTPSKLNNLSMEASQSPLFPRHKPITISTEVTFSATPLKRRMDSIFRNADGDTIDADDLEDEIEEYASEVKKVKKVLDDLNSVQRLIGKEEKRQKRQQEIEDYSKKLRNLSEEMKRAKEHRQLIMSIDESVEWSKPEKMGNLAQRQVTPMILRNSLSEDDLTVDTIFGEKLMQRVKKRREQEDEEIQRKKDLKRLKEAEEKEKEREKEKEKVDEKKQKEDDRCIEKAPEKKYIKISDDVSDDDSPITKKNEVKQDFHMILRSQK
eukprot:MONOS_987.1-p1 / transcript=MONOS_987.1 / gene=MONOS_987 / organism=Monocercomonoides_exilis_PA203 / gene_product=unspecified product / transcript_product=unspecified product / location=Mono_scaffold00016:179227-180261(+) / protein_length=345 / sequence_SO=supercontig / SO=protein_coding / is_pseudo=false